MDTVYTPAVEIAAFVVQGLLTPSLLHPGAT